MSPLVAWERESRAAAFATRSPDCSPPAIAAVHCRRAGARSLASTSPRARADRLAFIDPRVERMTGAVVLAVEKIAEQAARSGRPPAWSRARLHNHRRSTRSRPPRGLATAAAGPTDEVGHGFRAHGTRVGIRAGCHAIFQPRAHG